MISFVILHYKNLDDTISCIKSINNLYDNNQISLVVVDNNSLDFHEEKKLRKYTNDLVLLKSNIGVAKAYNKGADYARKKYNPDFICVMNNDILINQKEFLRNIISIYEKNYFDMLGPKIICEGDSVNPFPVFDTLEKISKRIERNEKLIDIYSNKFKVILFETYLKIKHFVKKSPKLKNGENEQENVALHGCLIIFSKKYYEKNEYLLPNDTFLFHEEEFLYFRCIQGKYKSLYSPTIEIIHKEGQALKVAQSDVIKRKKNKFIECNNSLRILKRKLENNDII